MSIPEKDAQKVLPGFTGKNALCIKCGNREAVFTEWVPLGGYTNRGTFGECLERRCGRCGYTWPEAVLS